MNLTKTQQAQALIRNRPYLIWYTKNFQNLSEESIFEAVINYGDWEDFKKLQDIFGIKTSHLLFKKAISSPWETPLLLLEINSRMEINSRRGGNIR